MSATRSLSNPPKYYYTLNAKQRRNWRKNTRRIEKNETLKSTYPPFQPSSDITIIHIHHLMNISTLNELIIKAQQTYPYVFDTEGEKNQQYKKGALIQIQFIHSTAQSTVILIETNYLPDRQTVLYEKIEELWSTIFNHNNEIITWGPIDNELEDFRHIEFIHIGNNIDSTNLQILFRSWYNEKQRSITHPEMERRDGDDSNDEEMDGIYDELNETTYSGTLVVWSLQDAIATTFNKFLDKSLTVNWWQCGLDDKLNTWTNEIFSRYDYNEQVEKQQRLTLSILKFQPVLYTYEK